MADISLARQKLRIWINITGIITAVSALAILVILALSFVPHIQTIIHSIEQPDIPVDHQGFAFGLMKKLIVPSIAFYTSLPILFTLSAKNRKLKRAEIASKSSVSNG